MSYTVFYEEVFGQPHEEGGRFKAAEFEVYEDAVAYCEDRLKEDVTGETLEEQEIHYAHHGLDYWISPEPEGKHFSSWDFMKNLFARE